jgi:hypothetical protein
MPSTHQDIGASMDESQKGLGTMKIKLLIFAGLETLANLVAVEDARFELGDSRFSWEEEFFHPPA